MTGAPVVPAGAVAARLCGGQVDNAGFNLVWPADTLRGRHVRRLVARLNRLEPYSRPSTCTLPASPGFDLVLRYPGGSQVRVHGDTAGTCEHVSVRGGRDRAGAPGVLRHTLSLIDARRRTDGPANESGSVVAALTCPRRWNDVSFTAGDAPVRAADAAGAVVCRYRLRLEPRHITQSAEGRLIGRARVRHPAAWVRAVAHGSRVDPCGGVEYDLEPVQDVVVFADRYGDLTPVSTAACWANELTGPRRYPSRELAERAASLVKR